MTLQGVTSVGLKNALDFAYTGQVSAEFTPQLKRTCITSFVLTFFMPIDKNVALKRTHLFFVHEVVVVSNCVQFKFCS